ncbi:MAG: RNase adapter RapZ [Rhodoferax sp.]
MTTPLQLHVVTGMSGSGKSVALHALEDLGFYCIDNLPPELLLPLVALQDGADTRRLAVAIDVRSAASLPLVPRQLAQLRARGVQVQSLCLDAADEALMRRFSETRRRHPLARSEGSSVALAASEARHALGEAIALERALLAELRAQSHVIDTTLMRATQLQTYVKSLVALPRAALTLVFESFAFKRGLPTDADYVFDVRMLPNPHYEPALRALTGRDAPVAEFLAREPQVQQMQRQITAFVEAWLGPLADNHRSYVTVAVGCTGGQHRSVYLVEQLAQHFGRDWAVLARHRELDAR